MAKYISLYQGMRILLDTITQNLRHIDYKRVTDLADDYNIYVTGEGVSKKLIQFVPRESTQLFAQRIALTQVTTPDIAGGCMKPMYKVGRAPATVQLQWKDTKTTEANKKQLLAIADDFYGETSVDDYLTYKMVELDSTDPNSFIVVEANGFFDATKPVSETNQKLKPYPFEVNSHEAINYVYDNNILQWLIVRNFTPIKDKDKKIVEAEKYTIYTNLNSVICNPIHNTIVIDYLNTIDYIEISEVIPDQLNINVNYYFKTNHKTESDRKHFIINVFEHKIGFVPAKRVGTIRDLTTRARTCVPLIHSARPYLEKSIKSVSEFDLTNCLHTFPQKIAYVDKCQGHTEAKDGSYETTGCLRGLTPSGHKCQECHGSGIKVHTTTADLIGIPMPKDPKDMVSLENVLVYKYPPTEILEFQKKLALYEWRYFATKAVWNSEIFDKTDVAQTATEKTIDLDAVYDTLKPFADTYSSMWRFIMQCIANLTDLGTDLKITHQFPKDFKMKPYSELLNDYRIANENNAPSYIKKALTHDITRKLYIDQPYEILKIETKDKYFPFIGKTESEINYILANDLTTEENKIFYAHFDLIFSDIEYEMAVKKLDFYNMTEEEQRKTIKEKIDYYVGLVREGELNSTATSFNNTPEDVTV